MISEVPYPIIFSKGINLRRIEYLQNIQTIHDTFLEFYLFDISSVSDRISR
jgi:hypothetical protein